MGTLEATKPVVSLCESSPFEETNKYARNSGVTLTGEIAWNRASETVEGTLAPEIAKSSFILG